eukprot:gene9355-10341_t
MSATIDVHCRSTQHPQLAATQKNPPQSDSSVYCQTLMGQKGFVLKDVELYFPCSKWSCPGAFGCEACCFEDPKATEAATRDDDRITRASKQGDDEDTDDTVILLFYWQQLKVHGLKELCVKTGVGDSSRFVAFHELAASQSHDICEVLPAVHTLTGCDYASKVGSKKAAIECNPAYHLKSFGITDGLSLERQIGVYAFVIKDDLLVPDLGLHPIPEKYSLFCTYGKGSTYDVPVERMAYLVVRFATVKALLQMMAQAARTHLVASIELTLCNTVSV